MTDLLLACRPARNSSRFLLSARSLAQSSNGGQTPQQFLVLGSGDCIPMTIAFHSFRRHQILSWDNWPKMTLGYFYDFPPLSKLAEYIITYVYTTTL